MLVCSLAWAVDLGAGDYNPLGDCGTKGLERGISVIAWIATVIGQECRGLLGGG